MVGAEPGGLRSRLCGLHSWFSILFTVDMSQRFKGHLILSGIFHPSCPVGSSLPPVHNFQTWGKRKIGVKPQVPSGRPERFGGRWGLTAGAELGRGADRHGWRVPRSAWLCVCRVVGDVCGLWRADPGSSPCCVNMRLRSRDRDDVCEKPTVWVVGVRPGREAGTGHAQPSRWGPHKVILPENTYQRRRKLCGHLQCDTHV